LDNESKFTIRKSRFKMLKNRNKINER